MKDLNTRLKKYRLEKGYSLKDLEKLTGISCSSLQRYETDSIKNISAERIEIIANALDVTPACLMGWESKDLPFSEYKHIFLYITEIGYSIGYNSEKDVYTLLKNGKILGKLTPEQIKSVADGTTSYIEFQLQNIISKNTTE